MDIRETIRSKVVELYNESRKTYSDSEETLLGLILFIEREIPKFKVGDSMRTLIEAKRNIRDGLPYVNEIRDGFYYCQNEKIPISEQRKYEYPPMSNIHEQ